MALSLGVSVEMNLRVGILLLGATLVVCLYGLTRPYVDFIVYWAAAHPFVTGHNPYSLPEVFQLQRALGFKETVPLMLLCGPWLLH